MRRLLVAALLLGGGAARASSVGSDGGPEHVLPAGLPTLPESVRAVAPAAPDAAAAAALPELGAIPIVAPAAAAGRAAAAGSSAAAPADLGPAYDGSAAARLTPALALTPEDQPAADATVRSLAADGAGFSVNGKPARLLSPGREDDGVVETSLAHPQNERLIVTVFHGPASLSSLDRKNHAVERLKPLAAAGAAPRLLEHGEAVVPGKGVAHFVVQEAVDGSSLAALPASERRGAEVRGLFERLERAGLALVVPPLSSAEWLLSRIVVGETPSGRGAYVVGAAAEPMEPAALAAHNAMLESLLEPAEPPPLKDDPSVSSERLEETAVSLVGGTNVSRDAAELSDGLARAPRKATERLRQLLASAVAGYWTSTLGRREKTSRDIGNSYSGRHIITETVPLPRGLMVAQPGGRWDGLEKDNARVETYGKLLEARPDLAQAGDAELLRTMFTAPKFDHYMSDEVFVSQLDRLTGALTTLAAKRPDLLSLRDYAAIMQWADGALIGTRWTPDFEPIRERVHRALEEGFRRAALTAPVAELLEATTKGDGGKPWVMGGFEKRVAELAKARPEFADALLEKGIPPSAARPQEPEADREWADSSRHSLRFDVVDDQTMEAGVEHALAGWNAYSGAYQAAMRKGGNDVAPRSVAEAANLYAQVYALGQVFGTTTAFGPKISLKAALAEARSIARSFLLSEGIAAGVKRYLGWIEKDFAGSSNSARKALQEMLLRLSLSKSSLYSDLPREDVSRFRRTRQRAVMKELRESIPALLQDFDPAGKGNIFGVLLTGSFAYGQATPDSDLDFFILTRPGATRTHEFIAALEALGREKGWPAFKIADYNVMSADSERVTRIRRGFGWVIFDAEGDASGQATEPYDKPSMMEGLAHRRMRARFQRQLRERLPKGRA